MGFCPGGFCPSGVLSQWGFVQWAFVLVGLCPSGLLSHTHIITMSLRQRFETARTVNQQFLNAIGITICETDNQKSSTWQRNSCSDTSREFLVTCDHKTARRHFAAQYEDMPLGSLRKIIFTDESRFCIDNSDGRKCVMRRKNERIVIFCVAEHER